MALTKEKKFTCVGKSREENINEMYVSVPQNQPINYDIEFWTASPSGNFAYTKLEDALWNEYDGLSNSNESGIDRDITKFVHAVNVDWDSPATISIPYLTELNNGQPIKNTGDLLYVIDKIADYLTNKKERTLKILCSSISGSVGKYKLTGLVDDQPNTAIVWTCNNQYIKFNTNVGSTVTAEIDFEKFIKDNIHIERKTSWQKYENSTNNWVTTFEVKWYNDMYSNLNQLMSLLNFNVVANYSGITPAVQNIKFNDISKLNLKGGTGIWYIDDYQNGNGLNNLSIIESDNTICKVKQIGSSTKLKNHILSFKPTMIANNTTISDNKPSIEFEEYYININDIYVTTLPESEYSSSDAIINNFLPTIKNNINKLLNLKLDDIYEEAYDRYYIDMPKIMELNDKNYFSEHINITNEWQVVCVPYVYELNYSGNVKKIDNAIIDNNATGKYFKNFTVYISHKDNSWGQQHAYHCPIDIRDIFNKQYLTFRSLYNSNTISFHIIQTNFNSDFVNSLDYSTDNGRTWKHTNSTYQSYLILKISDIKKYQRVLVRSNAKQFGKVDETNDTITNSSFFNMTSEVNVFGNIFSLIYKDDFNDYNTFKANTQYVFANLFYESKIKEAKNLILPKNLVKGCFALMFNESYKLKSLPFIGKATLADSCCEKMFYKCTGLTNVDSIIQSPKLEYKCYAEMFSGCTKLKNIQQFGFISSVAKYCCEGMYRGCTSLKVIEDKNDFKISHINNLDEGCFGSLFIGCINLETIPDDFIQKPNSNIKLAKWCYGNMFHGCEKLNVTFSLPATTMYYHCYDNMFSGCLSLQIGPELSSVELAEGCYTSMFKNCTNLKQLKNNNRLPAIELKKDCYLSMFEGCTNLEESPVIPNVNLTPDNKRCLGNMFKNCQNLQKITFLLESTNGLPLSDYTLKWVESVSDHGTFVKSITADWDEYDSYYVNEENDHTKSGVPLKWILNNENGNLGIKTVLPEDQTSNVNKYFNEYFTISRHKDSLGNIVASNISEGYDTWLYIKIGTNSKLFNDIIKKETNSDVTNKYIRCIQYSYDKNTWLSINGHGENGYNSSYVDNNIDTNSWGSKDFRVSIKFNEPNIYFRVTDNIETLNGKYDPAEKTGQTTWCTIYTKNCQYDVSGNIMSLVIKDEIDSNGIHSWAKKENYEKCKAYSFMRLFSNSTGFAASTNNENKNNLKDVSNLILPSKEVYEYGYEYMFEGCESIERAPIIFAEKIGARAMQCMFKKCTNLKTAKIFVSSMNDSTNFPTQHRALCKAFIDCKNLEGYVSLYTNIPKHESYLGIFNGCTKKFNINLYNNAGDSGINEKIGLYIDNGETWVTVFKLNSNDDEYNYINAYDISNLYPSNLYDYTTSKYNWKINALNQ